MAHGGGGLHASGKQGRDIPEVRVRTGLAPRSGLRLDPQAQALLGAGHRSDMHRTHEERHGCRASGRRRAWAVRGALYRTAHPGRLGPARRLRMEVPRRVGQAWPGTAWLGLCTGVPLGKNFSPSQRHSLTQQTAHLVKPTTQTSTRGSWTMGESSPSTLTYGGICFGRVRERDRSPHRRRRS